MIDEDIWKRGVKKITKEIKRAIEKTPNVSYLGLVGRDSKNHPVHLLEFVLEGETKRKEISSSGLLLSVLQPHPPSTQFSLSLFSLL